jgi:phosphatidylglycerol:prolipoprotein diacylglycerol transferase
MKPELVKIPFNIDLFGLNDGIPLEGYFTMVAFGFILAVILLYRWARNAGMNANNILDLWILMIVTGVFGARILSVIADGHFLDYVHLCTDPVRVDWPLTMRQCLDGPYDGMWDPVKRVCHPAYVDCLAWAKFWKGGLTYYGGFLLSVPSGIAFLHYCRMPVMRVVDGTGFVIPLGLAWGRIGCWFNGCCFGVITDSKWGISFPAMSQASKQQFEQGQLASIGLESLPVHPTQLYEAVFSLAIAALCYFWVERNKRFLGQTFMTFVVLYALGRFVEEFFRDDDRGAILGLSTSQIVGLVTAAIAGGAIFYFAARAKARAAELDAATPHAGTDGGTDS